MQRLKSKSLDKAHAVQTIPLGLDEASRFTFYSTPCLFKDSACIEGVKPFLIRHSNITIQDLGINAQSSATLDHQLNCAPLNLTKFHHPMKNVDEVLAPRSFISFRKEPIGDRFPNDLEHTLLHPNLRHTANDALYFIPGHAQVRLFPDMKGTVAQDLVSNKSYVQRLHPSLQRDDGLVYAIGFQLGLNGFGTTGIADPIFKADLRLPHSDMLSQTFHFTALGCHEQFRYCFTNRDGENMCGPYSGMPWDEAGVSGMQSWLSSHGYDHEARDYRSVWVRFARRSSLSYFTGRAATMTDYDRHRLANIQDEWFDQLKRWFMAAHFHARFSFVLNVLPGKAMTQLKEDEDESRNICDRILMRDGDYTNVNALGLAATVLGLITVCLMSYGFVGGVLVQFMDPVLPNWMRETKVD